MRRRVLVRIVVALAVFVVVIVAGVLVFLPGYVRRRAIELARREGIELTVGDVALSWSHVRMYALEARANELPGSVLRIEEADVDLDGLQPKTLHLIAPAALVASSQLELSRQLLAFRQDHPTLQLDGIERVTLERGSVTWPQGVLGADFVATDVSGDFAGTADLGDQRHLVLGKVTMQRSSRATGNAAYGPWRVRVDATRTESDIKIALDPAREADAYISVVTKGESTRSDVHVKRTKFSTLGVPASDVLLPAGLDPEIEVEAHFTPQEGALKASAGAVPLPRLGIPGDAVLDVAWAGNGKGPEPITHGTFVLGPFEGTVSGTVEPHDVLGGRADLTFKSKPVPCSRFTKVAAKEALGDLGQRLGELAEQSGLTKAVTGTTEVSGQLVVDTADLEATRYAVKPTVDCGVFPFKP